MFSLKSIRWFAVAVVISGGAATAAGAAEGGTYVFTPSELARTYTIGGQWAELETLMLRLTSSGQRADDGRHQLYLATGAIRSMLGNFSEDQDIVFEEWNKNYRRKVPGSAFAPILEALQYDAKEWRARGGGFASTVSPEGWRLFRSRSKKAWDVLQAAKASSSRLPSWYELSITIGMNAELPHEQVTAAFNEGIRKFPGYHALYFNYIRQFTPKWGGSFEEAADFINAQVAAKTNPDGEVLYARLYWVVDQIEGGDIDFFEDSRVDWARMRNGFELMMKQFPASGWNQANFAVYACRAGDARTYRKWRKGLSAAEFNQATPQGLSLEICEARFKVEA